MAFNNHTPREKKIKLLKDIQNGITDVNQLTPMKFGDIWFETSGELKNEMTGEILSKEKFDKKYPPETVITFS